MPVTGSLPYLAVCAIYRDEAPSLREWIEFHRLMGVERFFLYDNASEDAHLEVLAPYLEQGIVVLHEWPHFPGQMTAYEHCIANHAEDARWIAFIDLDEFLFSPTGSPLPDILRDYEDRPGVVVNWVMFGTSGHRTPPEGLVVESYVRRLANVEDDRHVKSIVNPRRVLGPGPSPHWFRYRDGSPVDELERPIDGPPFGFTETTTLSRLRINHYFTKSEQEFSRKSARPYAHPVRKGRPDPNFQRLEALNAATDEAIAIYLPALRAAIERTETAARSSGNR